MVTTLCGYRKTNKRMLLLQKKIGNIFPVRPTKCQDFQFDSLNQTLMSESLLLLQDLLIPLRSTSSPIARYNCFLLLTHYGWYKGERWGGTSWWKDNISFDNCKLHRRSSYHQLVQNELTLTTNRAKRMTPQLQTSAFLPSYFSPWGHKSVYISGLVLRLVQIKSRNIKQKVVETEISEAEKLLTLMTSGQA